MRLHGYEYIKLKKYFEIVIFVFNINLLLSYKHRIVKSKKSVLVEKNIISQSKLNPQNHRLKYGNAFNLILHYISFENS